MDSIQTALNFAQTIRDRHFKRIEEEIIGALSPYLTRHINRFGSYSLDLNRQPPTLDFGFSLIPSS